MSSDKMINDLKSQLMTVMLVQNNNNDIFSTIKNYAIIQFIELFFNKFKVFFNIFYLRIKNKYIKEPSYIYLCSIADSNWARSLKSLKDSDSSSSLNVQENLFQQLFCFYKYNSNLIKLLPESSVILDKDSYIRSTKNKFEQTAESLYKDENYIYLCSDVLTKNDLLEKYMYINDTYKDSEPNEFLLGSMDSAYWASTIKNLKNLKSSKTSSSSTNTLVESLEILYEHNNKITRVIPNIPFEIEKDIFLNIKRDKASNYIYNIFLKSDNINKYELMEWYMDITEKFDNNNNILYYYSMIAKEEHDIGISNINKKVLTIYTSRSSMRSNKSFDNLFGEHINFAKDKIDLFINSKKTYDKLGIPYTLGLLLYGPPGTGKTSFIKAVSNYTRKHIIYIDLKIATKTFLNNIFYKGLYIGKDNSFEIDIRKSIIIFEDIDCLGSIVLDRENKDYKDYENINENTDKQYDKIDLNFLLNLFDGVLEIPGRVIIMTTNCPDKLDKALIRDGRIDYKIKFNYCDDFTIKEMYKNFFNKDVEITGFGDKDNLCKVIPLEINKILCSNIDDENKALEEINKLKSLPKVESFE